LALELHQAEPNRPLYIVAVQSNELNHWLNLAGIELGDTIWKSTLAEQVSSIWVRGKWGQMIISPGMAADILVVNQAGTILPLHQLSVGAAGKLAGYKNYGDCRPFCAVKNIATGSTLKVHRKIDRLVFHIRLGSETLLVDDETAFNTWMKEDDQWVQLGALPIGRPFHPHLFTIRESESHLFERLKAQEAPFLTLHKIETLLAAQYDSGNVCIKTQSGNMLSLSDKESRDIIVRFCDICWSCGICR